MNEPYDIEAQIADFHKRAAIQRPDDVQSFIMFEIVAELKRMRDAFEDIAAKVDAIENKMM